MKRPGLGLVLLFAVFTARAQFPFTRSMEVGTGQLRPAISCMTQDSQGLLWVGSDIGVFRTDGDHSELVLRSEDHAVTAITALDEGIAAAFASGVVVRCGAMGCDTLFSDTLLGRFPILGMRMDLSGTLWSASGGAGVWLLKKGVVTRITQV
jgi:ligand-binding sensor domain-containing protein